jgi:hypothetical protein
MAKSKLVTETHTLCYPKGLLNPDDLCNFFLMPKFQRQWAEYGLTDIDLIALKVLIMIDPKRAPIMRGTGGLRKIRFVPPGWNTGKRGALRIGFSYSESESVVLLVTAYAKHDKANISPKERREIRVMLKEAWARV